jgi:hypothetical protein
MDVLPALKQFQKLEHGHASKVGALAAAATAAATQLNAASAEYPHQPPPLLGARFVRRVSGLVYSSRTNASLRFQSTSCRFTVVIPGCFEP